MEKKFYVELRVNFADHDRNDAMKVKVREGAQFIYAAAALLADGIKPQIAIRSDNFIEMTEQIMMFENNIDKGLAEIGPSTEADQPSDAMLEALRGRSK